MEPLPFQTLIHLAEVGDTKHPVLLVRGSIIEVLANLHKRPNHVPHLSAFDTCQIRERAVLCLWLTESAELKPSHLVGCINTLFLVLFQQLSEQGFQPGFLGGFMDFTFHHQVEHDVGQDMAGHTKFQDVKGVIGKAVAIHTWNCGDDVLSWALHCVIFQSCSPLGFCSIVIVGVCAFVGTTTPAAIIVGGSRQPKMVLMKLTISSDGENHPT